jgi:protein-glucosylgalactosylhydroxylysine glucosidase
MEGTAMVHLGYALSSEEHQADLGRFAARAEQGGFSLVMMSDHFDPWIDAQGQNPLVWTALGGMPRTAPFIANIRAFLTGGLYGLTGMTLSDGDPDGWCRRPVMMPQGWNGVHVERLRGRPASLTAEHGQDRARLNVR